MRHIMHHANSVFKRLLWILTSRNLVNYNMMYTLLLRVKQAAAYRYHRIHRRLGRGHPIARSCLLNELVIQKRIEWTRISVTIVSEDYYIYIHVAIAAL
jgi:hypothetical protein